MEIQLIRHRNVLVLPLIRVQLAVPACNLVFLVLSVRGRDTGFVLDMAAVLGAAVPVKIQVLLHWPLPPR